MLEKIKSIMADEDLKEILSKGLSFLIFRFAGLLCGFLFTYLIAVNYGAGVNGLVALSFTLLLCVSIFGRLGTEINLIRVFSLSKNDSEKGLFYKALVIAFVCSSIVAFLLYLLQDVFVFQIFDKPQLKPYIFWVVISIPFWSIVLVCGGLFRAKKQNMWFVFLNNSGRLILSVVVLLVMMTIYSDSLSPIKAHFFGVVLLAIIGVVQSYRVFNGVSFNSKIKSWPFVKESLPMMVSGGILLFLGWTDTFFLGVYETESVVGVYNVAIKIATLTMFSFNALNSILAPKIAKSFHEGDQIGYKKMISFTTRINSLITLMIVLGIIILHRYILGIFGEEFLSGASVLIILCIGQLAISLSGSVGTILQMIGHQRIYQNIVLIALIVNIVLNFILTPRYGAIGAAIATAISILCWNVLGVIYLKQKLNITSHFTLKKPKY